MKFLKVLLCMAGIVSGALLHAQSIPNSTDYDIINGNVTEALLRNYLKRNISMTGLVDLNPATYNCSQKIDATTNLPERVNGDEYNCWLEFIKNTQPKFINGMAGLWGGGDLWYYYDPSHLCDHFDQCTRTAIDIHNIDPQIICGASLDEVVDECMRPSCIRIQVPASVLAVYPLPSNATDNLGNPIVVFDESAMGCTPDYNPDITKQMTLAWDYYLGCKYIDAGFEALRIGQVNVVGFNDKNQGWDHTYRLIQNLKQYALIHGRRKFVLFDSQTWGIYHNNTQDLVLDMHSWPLNLKETYVESTQDQGMKARGDGINGNYDYEAVVSQCLGADASFSGGIYQNSAGGNNPSFGYVASNPFFLEFDNAGGSDLWLNSTSNQPPHANNSCHFPWSWDETTWFSQQSELYRNHFLIYAWHRIRCLDQAGYLSMLGRRGYSECIGCPFKWYRAYNSDRHCTDGFNQEDVIKNIWNANDNSLPQSLNGTDMGPYNKWTQSFQDIYQNNDLPDGRLFWGDFNGDGSIDILETADKSKGQWWDGWHLYLQQGGSFVLTASDSWPAWGERFYIGDYNGDGMDDFLVTADKLQNTSWQGWHLYLSTGSGFNDVASDSWPSWGERFYIGDYNGDGMDDFLITADKTTNANYVWDGYKVYMSTGSGFTAPTGSDWQAIWPSWGERFFPGDFNGDGNTDFLVTADKVTNTNYVWGGYKVYHSNTGISNFDYKANGYWPSWGEDFVVADWNGDGYDDFTVRPIYNNPWGVNWSGSKTYLTNTFGNHYTYAFDQSGLDTYPGILAHHKAVNDNLLVVSGNILHEYEPTYCDGKIKDGRRPAHTVAVPETEAGVLYVYPNPSKDGIFHINLPEEEGTVAIYDIQGRKIQQQDMNNATGTINMKSAVPGVYVLTFTTGKKVYNQRLIVK